MIPTKVKDLIPGIASTLGLPDEDLGNMISFYFKELNYQMSVFTHTSFVIRGLGNMSVKGWNFITEIEAKKKVLANSSNPDKIKSIEAEIELYNTGYQLWAEEKERQKQAKERKKNYYNNKSEKIDKDELEGKTSSRMEE